VKKLGAELIGTAFLIELLALKGRDQLQNECVFSVLQY
jgi:adenine/guanine phosphoribosyltransferase-like PRPP-binding protein